MAKPEPFYYADRRLELPAPDMGTVQFEANVVAEIYHGVNALLSRFCADVVEAAMRERCTVLPCENGCAICMAIAKLEGIAP